jgi:hypothetical protein
MLIILLSYVSFYEMPVPVSQLSYIDLIIHHPAAHHLAAKITSIYHVRQLFIQFFPSDSSHTPRQQVRGAPPLYFCVRRQRARARTIYHSITHKKATSFSSFFVTALLILRIIILQLTSLVCTFVRSSARAILLPFGLILFSTFFVRKYLK